MQQNGPWKIKSSEEKYKNPWIRVREDQVIRPDGKDGIVGVVEMGDGISVLPLDDDGYVYLVDQFRYTMSENTIEVASGKIDDNEKPLDTAKRELKEETGITADEWIDLGFVNSFTSVVKSQATLYLARKLSFGESDPEGTEQIKLLKVKFEDALKMVMESKITHGASCVLILKAAEYFRNQKNN